MAKIIGPGSLIVDVTGFAPHLPVAGETTKGSTLRFGPGGKGSNQLTAAEKNEHAADSDVVDVLNFVGLYLGPSLRKSSVESLAQKFGEDGTFDNIDEETKKLFTAWSFSKLNTIVKEDAQGVLKMSELSKEINTNFAILMQGLEECTAEKEGAVIENSGVLFNFVCTSKKVDNFGQAGSLCCGLYD